MRKKYVFVHTASLVSGGYAGGNTVVGKEWNQTLKMPIAWGYRSPEDAADIRRAEEAAEEVFRAIGHFPGTSTFSALVRVDGGRAIVCASRERRGW